MGIVSGDFPYEAIQAELRKVHATDTFKLAICLPTTTMVYALFMVDLVALTLQLGLSKIPLPWARKSQIRAFNMQSSLIHSSRQNLLREALCWGATHILFVDSDQTFPPDVVHRLAKHDKLFVGANITTKEIPARPCAINLKGEPCFSDPDKHGLEEVALCGTGLILMNTKIFGTIPPPYFLMPYDEEKKVYSGEDVYFCNRLREAGIPLYIDHDVSRDVGHLGVFEFKHELVGETPSNTLMQQTEGLRQALHLPLLESAA